MSTLHNVEMNRNVRRDCVSQEGNVVIILFPLSCLPGCVLCPEMTVGLVYYPPTAAPQVGTVPVTTECVRNAESASSLEVTCGAGGVWSDETPECKCKEDFLLDANATGCILGIYTHLHTPTYNTL